MLIRQGIGLTLILCLIFSLNLPTTATVTLIEEAHLAFEDKIGTVEPAPMPRDVFPLFRHPRFCLSDRDELKREVEKSEDPSRLVEFLDLFAKDPRCPDWDPTATSLKGPTMSLYPIELNTDKSFVFDLAMKIKYILHLQLYAIFYDFFLRGCKIEVAEALFNPGDVRLDKYCSLYFALFRLHIIPRHYYSAREFWEKFEACYENIKDHGYDWDWKIPGLNLEECKGLMEEKGDKFGVEMADMIYKCIGNDLEFTDRVHSNNWDAQY